MKRLSRFNYFLIVLAILTSCEKESIENLNETGVNILKIEETDPVSIETLLDTGMTMEEYITSIQSETSTVNKVSDKKYVASLVSESGVTAYYNEQIFIDENCNNLNVEDFQPTNDLGAYYAFPNSLNSNTDNDAFSSGEILPNITISNSHEYLGTSLAIYGKDMPYGRDHHIGAWWSNRNDDYYYMIVDFNDIDVRSASFEIYRSSLEGDVEVQVFGVSGLLSEFYVNVSPNKWFSLKGDFFGVSSEESITRITIRAIFSNYAEWVGFDNLTFGTCDTDNDGCIDGDDAHIYSDLSENISIGKCDFSIENKFTDCGTTMMDEVNDLIARVCEKSNEYRRPWERPYDIDREFRRQMNSLAATWASKRLITWSEATSLIRCLRGFEVGHYCNQD